MNQSDTLGLITAHLSNSKLKKLYLLGIISLLSHVAKSNLWWYMRVQVLCARKNLSLMEAPSSDQIDWKEVYLILCRQPSGGSKTVWNREDNLTASKIIARSSLHVVSEDVIQCAREGSINILSEYIDYCDPDSRIECLFEAARCGHSEVVTLLLERQDVFTPEYREFYLEKVLQYVCRAQSGNERGNYTLIVTELLSGTAGPELFYAALEYDDNWEIVELLLEHSPEDMELHIDGILRTAVTSDRRASAGLLISAGADPLTVLENGVEAGWQMLEFLLEQIPEGTIPSSLARSIFREALRREDCRCLDLLMFRQEVRDVALRVHSGSM